MISAQLPGVTGAAALLKTSWQSSGSVSPMVVILLTVQPTAVLMSAVAF
jgi:hypothetical protein